MAAPSTRLGVRVSPGAQRGGVAGGVGEVWKLRVTAPAEGGRANEAVVRLLAEAVDVPRRQVALVSGHTAREKVVQLEGVEAAEGQRTLAGASARAPSTRSTSAGSPRRSRSAAKTRAATSTRRRPA